MQHGVGALSMGDRSAAGSSSAGDSDEPRNGNRAPSSGAGQLPAVTREMQLLEIKSQGKQSLAEDLVSGSATGKMRSFDRSSVVSLNVGGVVFVTTVSTLTRQKESMLATMFSGRFPLREDADGHIFLDRDGTHFDKILNFLRDGDLPLQYPRDKTLCLSLLREADYYQLSGLRTLLEEFLDEATPEVQLGRGIMSIGKQVTVLRTEKEKEALLAYGGPTPIVLLEVSSSSFGEKKDAIIFHHLALFDRLSAEYGHKLHFVKQIVYTGKEWKFFVGGRLLHSIFFYNQYNGKHSFQEEVVLDRILKLILSSESWVQSGSLHEPGLGESADDGSPHPPLNRSPSISPNFPRRKHSREDGLYPPSGGLGSHEDEYKKFSRGQYESSSSGGEEPRDSKSASFVPITESPFEQMGNERVSSSSRRRAKSRRHHKDRRTAPEADISSHEEDQ